MNELKLPDALPTGFTYTDASGLTGAEAEKRKKDGRAKKMPPDDGKSTFRIVTENVCTLFNGLNLLLGLALILVGSWRNLLFLGVVVSNTGIAIYQELKARNTIRQLKLLHAPRARVIRDGRETEIASEDVVEGDILVLRSGDQVIADSVVVSGGGRAMESLLTGESDGIPKQKGDWVYSGSYLNEGKILCQVVYVGSESYVGRLSREAKQPHKKEAGLMKELKRLIRWDAIALLPLGLALFLKQVVWQQLPMRDAVPPTVAAMLGMIPEGLMLLTSIAMAAGVLRLARRQVLVQELDGIEGLARVDIVCLDKTGTLTSGHMKMAELLPLTGTEAEARQALSRLLGAFDEDSPTLRALREAVAPGLEEPLAVQPFSSQRKKSAACFRDGKTLILGAPAFVMREDKQDGEHLPENIRKRIAERTGEGKRVLLLAEAEGRIEGGTLPAVTRPLALCSLTDEMRPHVEETIRYFHEEGVSIRVISGDDPVTVSRIAKQAGVPDAEKTIDMRTVRTEQDIREACGRYTVFGRVSPEQKKQLVEAMRAAGHTVAMTGDGVNDIPAMRAADCSIAMEEGASAARHTAQITLLESDFGVVPEIVLEGRRVINNMFRSATLFLTKTIFSFLLSLITLAMPGMYPFQPIQMSLVSACTVGIPGFFLAMEKSGDRVQGSFLSSVIRRALPGGVAVALCATLAMLLTLAGWSAETCSTLATWVAGTMGIIALARACWPIGRARALILGGSAVLFVLLAMLMEHVFFLTRLRGTEWLALAGLILLGSGIYLLTMWMERKQKKTKEAAAPTA